MLVPTGAARVFARGVPRAVSPIASPHEAAEACVWDRSSRWGGAWGGDVGAKRVRVRWRDTGTHRRR